MTYHPRLTENDLRNLFEKPKFWQTFWHRLSQIVRYAASFLILFGLFFLLINFPAYWQKLKYSALGQEKYSQNLTPNEKIILEPLKKIESKISAAPANSAEHLPQNRLIIPALKINAPIVWEVPTEETINRLKEGVVHYKGTNLPGENGNVFITGHSSNFWWDDGLFKQIFALLDKIEIGSKIYITYEKNLYIYEVENKKIVNPTEIEVLKPGDHSILSLMTCHPVGTTLHRLIVTAKQISPAPDREKVNKNLVPVNRLPVIR